MYKVIAAFIVSIGATLLFVAAPVEAQRIGDKGCETNTGVIECESRLDAAGDVKDGIEGTGLWSLLLTILNIMTGLVGVAALAGVVYGAVLYASAGGKSDQVKKAAGILTNVAVGVIIFASIWSLSNYLIPGGVFTP